MARLKDAFYEILEQERAESEGMVDFVWGEPKDKEFTKDDPTKIGTGAIKYDGGKPAIFRGVIDYFPRALNAVGQISTFGAEKYAWKGWEGVDDGVARYSDAMMRHLLKEGSGEAVDTDSGLLHAAHAAWGALARLELMLRKEPYA